MRRHQSNKLASKERVQACRNYIRESTQYTIPKLLEDHGLWRDIDTSGSQPKLSCPFHSDTSPSFYINLELDLCNCLACGKGGDYMKYLTVLNQELLQSGLNFYSLMENLLRNDPTMQVSLGFNSIMIDTADYDPNRPIIRRKLIKPVGDVVIDFSDLSSVMKKKGLTSMEEIKLAVLYSQEGYTADEIYKILTGSTMGLGGSITKTGINIEDLLEDISF